MLLSSRSYTIFPRERLFVSILTNPSKLCGSDRTSVTKLDQAQLWSIYREHSPEKMSSKEGEEGSSEQDRQVEMWKVKKLIKSLQAARG